MKEDKRQDKNRFEKNFRESGFEVVEELIFNEEKGVFEGVLKDAYGRQLKVEIKSGQPDFPKAKFTFQTAKPDEPKLPGKSFTLPIAQLGAMISSMGGGADASKMRASATSAPSETGEEDNKKAAPAAGIMGGKINPDSKLKVKGFGSSVTPGAKMPTIGRNVPGKMPGSSTKLREIPRQSGSTRSYDQPDDKPQNNRDKAQKTEHEEKTRRERERTEAMESGYADRMPYMPGPTKPDKGSSMAKKALKYAVFGAGGAIGGAGTFVMFM